MNIQSFCGVLTGLALVNPCAAFLQNMPAANAGTGFPPCTVIAPEPVVPNDAKCITNAGYTVTVGAFRAAN